MHQDVFAAFLEDFRDDVAREDGAFLRRAAGFAPVAIGRNARSLQELEDLREAPPPLPEEDLSDRLAEWVRDAPDDQRRKAGLDLPLPPAGVHFVPGAHPIFYDFRNSDIALHELREAGARLEGRLLDFGCSSGRNLAVLRRAFGDALQLHGADPAGPSIEWLRSRVEGVDAVVSGQEPPLPYPDGVFDLAIAKSVWTHFSPAAARRWFREMARLMAPGAHLFFSTHGPHDVASRIETDVPRPRYERFAGHPSWTCDAFLAAVVAGLREAGHFFRPYRSGDHQKDIGGIEGGGTEDWGLAFMTEPFVRSLLPGELEIVRRRVARTGNRHDAYVVRRR